MPPHDTLRAATEQDNSSLLVDYRTKIGCAVYAVMVAHSENQGAAGCNLWSLRFLLDLIKYLGAINAVTVRNSGSYGHSKRQNGYTSKRVPLDV